MAEDPTVTEADKLFNQIILITEEPDLADKADARETIKQSKALQRVLAHILRIADERFKTVGMGDLTNPLSISKLTSAQGEARGLTRAVGLIIDLVMEKKDGE